MSDKDKETEDRYRKAVEEEKKGGVFGEKKGKWAKKQPPPYKGQYGKEKKQ
jgi:hypothetical protein